MLKLKASASCIPQSNQDGWLFKAGEINVKSGLCLSRLPRGSFVVDSQSTISKSSGFYLIDLCIGFQAGSTSVCHVNHHVTRPWQTSRDFMRVLCSVSLYNQ